PAERPAGRAAPVRPPPHDSLALRPVRPPVQPVGWGLDAEHEPPPRISDRPAARLSAVALGPGALVALRLERRAAAPLSPPARAEAAGRLLPAGPALRPGGVALAPADARARGGRSGQRGRRLPQPHQCLPRRAPHP